MRLDDIFKSIAVVAFAGIVLSAPFANYKFLALLVFSLSILTLALLIISDYWILKPYEAAILGLMGKVDFNNLANPNNPQIQSVKSEFPWFCGIDCFFNIIQSDCEDFMFPGTRISELKIHRLKVVEIIKSVQASRPMTVVSLQVSRV